MIVICEECGKKYRFDQNLMKSDKAKFNCKQCNHLISIAKSEDNISSFHAEPREEIKISEESVQTAISSKAKGLTLLPKMLFLFLLIPSIFLILAGFLYYEQLQDLSTFLIADSKIVVTNMSEEIIAETSRSVGKQCKLYLESHPKLSKEEFNTNSSFKSVALVKVGNTGYTALYEKPLSADGAWPTWVHQNPKIIGVDLKFMEKKNPEFWKIFSAIKDGKEGKGYYKWEDPDGKMRDKFMVSVPIEGTNYAVSATTYIDEFTQPVRTMEDRANLTTNKIIKMVIGILAATLIIIALIAFIYSHKLSRRIKTVTNHAERISVGELDAELQVNARDEIGDLAEAITRMQDSIRFSIERLRRRK
jgi:HAMP domain-containing protein